MIDSHAHVASEQFDKDRNSVIARTKQVGVTWIEVGTTVEESKKALEFPYASVGVHPYDVAKITEDNWQELATLADHKNCCAIGEVGLDFSRGGALHVQEEVLKKFMSLAQAKSLPMIFHVRNASTGKTPIGKTLRVNAETLRVEEIGVEEVDVHTELIRILREYSDTDRPKGVIHTFSGTLAQAKEYISLGMMVSFSGVITFKNAGDLKEIAKTISLDKILVETDCPFLTPVPYRGKRNEPIYVKHVIQKIAELRGSTFTELEQATEKNTKKLFTLDGI